MTHSHKLAAFLSFVFFLVAPVAFAGTVSGTVRNGTTGKPAAGVEMILIQLQGGMQPVDNTKTDANGRYQFTNPGLGGQMPMLLRAVYQGVSYHTPVPAGTTTADVEVFDHTDKPSAVAVSAHAVILQPNGSELVVGEEYSIDNKTQPPLTYYREDGSFLFSLPAGAQLGEVSATGSSGMPVVQATMDKGKGQEAIAYAFRPGENEIRISYKLPYPDNQTKLRLVPHYPEQRLAVFVPPTIHVTGDGFSPAGQDQGFSVYLRESVAANTPVDVAVSGTAPPPPQDNGASAAAGSEPGAASPEPGASGDSGQNPSVNSRLDQAGAEAPTETATTLPARLDSLKWILVGGFASIFALGFIFLWRRPQVMAATATSAAAPAPVPTAPPASVARASASSQAAVAEADRQVRGSLDEMKDTLFRLELRRQAGTITEDEYARERQRIEQLLRGLVRG